MSNKPKRSLPVPPPGASVAPATRRVRERTDGKSRLTVDLPDRAHRALKLRAVERGKSMRDYILELLRADRLEW